MVTFLVVVAVILAVASLVAARECARAELARDALGEQAESDHAAIVRLKELNAETAAAVGRANDRHQAAEKRCVEAWKLLEAEKAGREADGVTHKAREGQLISERDALRRKLEVRGVEMGMMFEVMAEWLRAHGHTAEG